MTQFALILSSLLFGLATWLVAMELVRSARMRQATAGDLNRRVRNTVLRASALVAPRVPVEFRKRTDKQITMAGGLNGLTTEVVFLAMLVLSLVGLLFAILAIAIGANAGIALLLPVAGAIVPITWLRDQVQRRHADIQRQLPFHLDLLTLGVEAGLDFTQALAKMVERGKVGALREEFSFTLSRIRVGVSRSQAMKEMSERVDLPAMSAFLSSLIQADKLGMSLGKVLRIQADGIRQDRSQRAEKRANEAPVKILIPLVLFIFPTIWIILFAPLVYSMAFSP